MYSVEGQIWYSAFSTTDLGFTVNLYVNGSQVENFDSSGVVSADRSFATPFRFVREFTPGDTVTIVHWDQSGVDESTQGGNTNVAVIKQG